MTEIYINHRHKKGIITPNKCGSTAFGNVLLHLPEEDVPEWQAYHTTLDTPFAKDVIQNFGLSDYEFIGISRDPVQWYVSGLRWVLATLFVRNDEEYQRISRIFSFPKKLTEHLQLVLEMHQRDMEYDEWWRDHCFYNPYMHFTDEMQVYDLSNWEAIKKWIDGFYRLKFDNLFVVNKTDEADVKFPILSNTDIFLLKELYKQYWKNDKLYNIDKSINDYIKKV